MAHIPKVSVCIPAFEQPEYLLRAVESVLVQSIQDFEIIITDDSFTDRVAELVKKWGHDSRIIYHRNRNQLGSPENWNEALKYARSELIKFLHHDDWFTNGKSLEKFVNAIESDREINFVFSAANACEDDGSIIFLHRATSNQIDSIEREPKLLQFGNFVGAPSATIFRKTKEFQFDKELRWVVDIDAYISILSNNAKFLYLFEPLVSIASNGAHQVTRVVTNDNVSRVREHLYLYNKHQLKKTRHRINGMKYLNGLFNNFTLEEVYRLISLREKEKQRVEEKLVMNIQLLKKITINFYQKFKRVVHNFIADKKPLGKYSYSQSGEDMIVDFLMMWIGIDDIYYLDIGANHPVRLSNTYHFYKKGAKGILVEPDIDLCKKLKLKRPKDQVINLALGTNGEGIVDMYVMTSRTLNTLDKHQAEELHRSTNEKIEQIRSVKLMGINEFIDAEFVEKKPNYVSLDIEGLDYDILESWDFDKLRPDVFCVETLTYTQNNTEEKIDDIINLMLSNGYVKYADTYLNTIFVSEAAWNKRPLAKIKSS